MASTRTRLTVAYGIVLVGTMLAFGMSLWYARMESADQQLGLHASALADRILAIIKSAQLAGKRLAYVQDNGLLGQEIKPTQQLGELLDPRPGFYVVIDSTGKLLYSSPTVRLLDPDDQEHVLQVADSLGSNFYAKVTLSDTSFESRVLLTARRDPAAGPYISRVVAGLPTDAADL